MKFKTTETAMLLVALSNLIADYRRSMKRAARNDMPAMVEGCEHAIIRYTRLAKKIAKS